ncbi:MAG: hypothetical protein JXA42_18925 [Anaerolineales bacterium]|nr:hypothetical protein [Anaerolineales bacterium]
MVDNCARERKIGVHAIRIYIIASHPLFAQGVSSLLEDQPDTQIVGISELNPGTLQRIVDLKPDVVIVDLEPNARGPVANFLLSKISGLKLVGLSLEEENITVTYLQQKTGAAVEDLVAAVRSLPSAWLPLQRQMRILAAIQGSFGNRVVDNIRLHAPPHWNLSIWRAPPLMPLEQSSLVRLLPKSLPAADLVLGLGESPQMAHLLPEMVARSGARAMLAPIENPLWLPVKAVRELQESMDQMGVATVFPKPFCSLTMRTYNEASWRQSFQDAHVAEFARYFGRPELRILFDDKQQVTHCEVRRDAACGFCHVLSDSLIGCSIEKIEGLTTRVLVDHHCPSGVNIDPDYGTPLYQVADMIAREAVRREVEPFLHQREAEVLSIETNRKEEFIGSRN